MRSTSTVAKLRVRNLKKTYGSVTALEPIDLEIREGEFLTLLGPSGSGKTTLLSMIAGLTYPDSGEVWIDGREVTHAPPDKRDIGMVFQNYALFPHMSVFDNIAFPLRMRKFDRLNIAAEVERVLNIVRLPQLSGRLPSQLSGGQRQRIALARCIVYRPSIILMDEPLGALDKKLREQMQLEIKRLHTDLGITILYVTHDQEEALLLSDRVCLMNNARIEQIGTPDDLYFRPATLFAADFLGESNILDAERDLQSGQIRLNITPGMVLACQDDGFPADRSLKIVLRPENVELLQNDARADNEIEVVIADVMLAGQITRCYARLPNGQVILSSSLTRPGKELPAIGSKVRFGWSKAANVLLPVPNRERA